MNARAAVAVLTRQPAPGRTKSRLAERVGEQSAAVLAEAFLRDTLAALADDDRWDVVLFVDPAGAVEAMTALTGISDVRPQTDGELGARMLDAARRLAADGYAPVVIVGSDLPTLSAQHIELALDGLGRADVVFGPAEDGGYYLAGMNRPQAALFDDGAIEWGSETVLETSQSLATAAGLDCIVLQPERDIDTAADLDWLCAHLDGLALGGAPLPRHTAEALRALDLR